MQEALELARKASARASANKARAVHKEPWTAIIKAWQAVRTSAKAWLAAEAGLLWKAVYDDLLPTWAWEIAASVIRVRRMEEVLWDKLPRRGWAIAPQKRKTAKK